MCLQAWAAISGCIFLLLSKQEACNTIGIEVEAQRMLTVFELLLQQSVAVIFLQIKGKGCFFHCAQAIYMYLVKGATLQARR